MKKVFKFFGFCLLMVYLIVAVGLTVCLLNYNDYKITVINDNSVLIVDDDVLEPSYHKGDLLIINKNDNDDIHVNDKIFFYNQYEGKVVVNLSTVTKTEKITDTETTFTVDNKYDVSSEYVIGKSETTKVFTGIGQYLKVLESKWGFLIIIILPISLLFIYEIYAVIMEIKNPKKKVEKQVKVVEIPKKNPVEEPKVVEFSEEDSVEEPKVIETSGEVNAQEIIKDDENTEE